MIWRRLLGAIRFMPRRKQAVRGITVRTAFSKERDLFEVVLDANGNEVAVLTAAGVLGHANVVQAASSRAAFDAAMYRQAVEDREMTPRQAAALVNSLRRDRSPLDPDATAPLVFKPQLDVYHDPKVQVSLRRTVIGRWSVFQADDYVRTLLDLSRRAENETEFHYMLRMFDGMSPTDARLTVEDIATFHHFS